MIANRMNLALGPLLIMVGVTTVTFGYSYWEITRKFPEGMGKRCVFFLPALFSAFTVWGRRTNCRVFRSEEKSQR